MNSTIDYGIEMIPDGNGNTIHSRTNLGAFMGSPVYGVRKAKELIVSVPFSDVVLDFSNLDGKKHYEEVENTYTLYIPCNTKDKAKSTSRLMSTIVNTFNNFTGFVTDDFLKASGNNNHGCALKHARCTQCKCDADPMNGLLTVTVKFKGQPDV